VTIFVCKTNTKISGLFKELIFVVMLNIWKYHFVSRCTTRCRKSSFRIHDCSL